MGSAKHERRLSLVDVTSRSAMKDSISSAAVNVECECQKIAFSYVITYLSISPFRRVWPFIKKGVQEPDLQHSSSIGSRQRSSSSKAKSTLERAVGYFRQSSSGALGSKLDSFDSPVVGVYRNRRTGGTANQSRNQQGNPPLDCIVTVARIS